MQPPTNQLNGGTIVQNDTSTYNAGIAQALPWGGGDFALQFNNNKQVTSNIFANFNPTFNANFNATYTQPLLRGFPIDGTRQQLRVTAINRDISEIQLRGHDRHDGRQRAQRLLGTALRACRPSTSRAARSTWPRSWSKTTAPAWRSARWRRSTSCRRKPRPPRAGRRWRRPRPRCGTAELALKRLIVNGTDDPLWRSTITPIDRPEFRPEPLDVEGAVRKALDSRTDLEQARKTHRQQRRHDPASCATRRCRPSTSSANYGAQGLGGTQFIRQGTGLGSTVIGTIPGGYRRRARAR